ncbi:MAG: hypothetical protein JST59_16235 [Actinobacteria bacterium]|nr:hypothetical protein [Actinomycetota bacterium]
MRILRAVLLVPLLLALLAGTAAAKSTRLDPSFGAGGKSLVSVPKGNGSQPTELALGPNGGSYVLDGSLLLAFDSNGAPDKAFGGNGRVRVTASVGETRVVSDLAVDSRGRVLVVGTVDPSPGTKNAVAIGESEYDSGPPATEAFVIRYLPDGSRDPSFGVGGEVNSTFGAPRVINQPPYAPRPIQPEFEHASVQGLALVVASGDEPVVGGSYVANVYEGYGVAEVDQAFAIRLGTNGARDPNFGGGETSKLAGATVRTLLGGPQGSLSSLAFESSIAGHGGPQPSEISTLAADGSSAPGLDPARPSLYVRPAAALDPQGRMLVGEMTAAELSFTSRGFGFDYPRLLRLLPDGDVDTSYGHGGAAPLKPLGRSGLESIAIDSRGRAVVGVGSGRWKLARVNSTGKIDHTFAKGSVVNTGFGRGTTDSLVALAIDGKGRIVAIGRVKDKALATGEGIGLVRYLPGS